jgi:hypothetical protein
VLVVFLKVGGVMQVTPSSRRLLPLPAGSGFHPLSRGSGAALAAHSMQRIPPTGSTPQDDSMMHHRPPSPAHSEALMPEAHAMLPSRARSALRDAAAALDLAERYQQPLEMSLALAQMARCYRALQAQRPAALYLERALGWARMLGAADQAVEVLCLLAETHCSMAELHAQDGSRRSHAALERTRDWASEATSMSAHVADPQWEIKVLLRISDVLDRCGDHDDAVELQSRAMRLMYGPHAGPDAAIGVQPGQQTLADG